MEICGEHGADIAYSGRDCPACEQIEDIEKNHKEEIEQLNWDHSEEIEMLGE